MNRSEIFAAAHKAAKKGLLYFNSYRAAFASYLKAAYAKAKAPVVVPAPVVAPAPVVEVAKTTKIKTVLRETEKAIYTNVAVFVKRKKDFLTGKIETVVTEVSMWVPKSQIDAQGFISDWFAKKEQIEYAL